MVQILMKNKESFSMPIVMCKNVGTPNQNACCNDVCKIRRCTIYLNISLSEKMCQHVKHYHWIIAQPHLYIELFLMI